ncbi:MAG: hypothetical protein V4671_04130 [Armatimonadota bacterium]
MDRPSVWYPGYPYLTLDEQIEEEIANTEATDASDADDTEAGKWFGPFPLITTLDQWRALSLGLLALLIVLVASVCEKAP